MGAGCHTRRPIETERPCASALIVAAPPSLAAAVPMAVHAASVSTVLPTSLVHVAAPSELLSGSAGLVLAERTSTPLLTCAPVSGAVFCSQEEPSAK